MDDMLIIERVAANVRSEAQFFLKEEEISIYKMQLIHRNLK